MKTRNSWCACDRNIEYTPNNQNVIQNRIENCEFQHLIDHIIVC